MRNHPSLVVIFALTFALVATAGYGLGRSQHLAIASVWAAQSDSLPPATWNSTMLWRPTLEEAGIALAEVLNQIDASCSVDVDPVVASNGDGPEGPVYAFTVSWTC